MLSSAIRVLARTAAIQLEEVAAAHAVQSHRSADDRRRPEPTSVGTGSLPPHMVPKHGSSVGTASSQNASQQHSHSIDGEEKSEEVKEVERKIERLLQRVKQPQHSTQHASTSTETTKPVVGELPDSVKVPGTIRLNSSISPTGSPTSGHKDNAAVSASHASAPAAMPFEGLNTASTSASSAYVNSKTQDSERSAPNAQGTTNVPESVIDTPLASASTTPVAHQSSPVSATQPEVIESPQDDEDAPVVMRASRVPSSRLGRLFHYGSLAASLSFGAASETLKRSTGGGGTGSVFMSDANVRRLVATLGRMRGAALKLGQFMSIQDNNMLPPEIEKVLHQVQAHANYMPEWQMEKVLSEELGTEWQSLFSSFDRTPIASASIGQVHRATLASNNTPVAVKIQFPGIASSINSDLSNLSILLRSSAILPPGLFLQNTIKMMRIELEDECDYVREAESGKRFEEFLKDDTFFVVPKVIDEATTGKVLTSEWMSGKPLSRMKGMSQETRDKIGTNILRLCLQELFHFRFMQTDPNWANFLYDQQNDKIQLIDFGASREYTKEFMDGWFRLLKAAIKGDREVMRVESQNLGYLTGEENDEMLNAHLDSMSLVASPFCHEGPYAFANQTITDSVRALVPVMLKHRLTPPPPETYSLNRKLSGAFLMCARLGANVDCGKLWKENVAGYKEG